MPVGSRGRESANRGCVSNSRGPESTNRGYESVVVPLRVCKSHEWDNTGHEESACRGHESIAAKICHYKAMKQHNYLTTNKLKSMK